MAVDFSQYEGKFPPQVLDAVKALFAAKPDQEQAFTQDYGADMPRWLDSVVGWWSDNGHQVADKLDQFAPELNLLDALGYKVNPEATTPTGTLDPNNPNAVPYEQVLFGDILKNYINPDLAADPGRRDQANQIVGDINRSLDQAVAANNAVFGGQFDGAQYLQLYPDVAAWAQQAVAAGQYPDLQAAALAHYQNYGRNEGRSAPLTKSRLELENDQAGKTGAALAASAADAAQSKLAALDQRKAEMTAALDRMSQDRSGALDQQTAQLREGLAQLETERKGALDQLTQARIAAAQGNAAARVDAAQGQVTGINLGLQAERDRIAAADAAKGFVGGSSMTDAALARATIGARQSAAETMGNAQVANAQELGAAKVANASDSRTLGDQIASQRFDIGANDATTRRGIAEEQAKGRFNLDDTISTAKTGTANDLATQTQAARDAATQAKQGYFDNDFSRRLQAALLPATIGTQKLNLLDAAGNVGQAGLTRALQTLNWFSTANNPPTAGYATTTPSQVGNDIAALGAGLTKSAFNMGNAYGWDKIFGTNKIAVPSASTTTPGGIPTGGAALYTNPLT